MYLGIRAVYNAHNTHEQALRAPIYVCPGTQGNRHKRTCISAMEGRHVGSKANGTPDRLPKNTQTVGLRNLCGGRFCLRHPWRSFPKVTLSAEQIVAIDPWAWHVSGLMEGYGRLRLQGDTLITCAVLAEGSRCCIRVATLGFFEAICCNGWQTS